MNTPIFHLAFPVDSLEAARQFYVETLGCKTGRESEKWIDFDFFGHQVVAHLVEEMPKVSSNEVDGKDVPANHFGVILEWDDWQKFSAHLTAQKADFLVKPYIRFEGEPGEQATLFISDPSGNGLEFKAFRNIEVLFAR